MSTDQPLGGPTGDPTPFVVTQPSIVDTILNLDEFLSGDVRLAEKTARFCTRPDIEAAIDEKEHQLGLLVDATGKRLAGANTDEALSGGSDPVEVTTALELHELRKEYAAAMRSVRMRQLPDDEWQAFKVEHREAFATTDQTEARVAMLDQLLVKTAVAPAISAEQLAKLRHRVGSPQIDQLISVAWVVNTQSGVSVPKSQLSSAVLKRLAPAQS